MALTTAVALVALLAGGWRLVVVAVLTTMPIVRYKIQAAKLPVYGGIHKMYLPHTYKHTNTHINVFGLVLSCVGTHM